MPGVQARRVSNADARVLFMNSAIRKCQWANPSQTPALGTTLSTVLPKAGIARNILVTVSLPLTLGTAASVPSPKAPFNLFTNIHLQDYAGIDRVNSSCYMLSQLSILKRRMWEPSSLYPFTSGGPNALGVDPYQTGAAYPFNITAPYTSKAAEGGTINGPSFNRLVASSDGAVEARWKIPTVTSGNLVFSFWIPVSFGPDDIRGGLLLNVPNGQVVLQMTINNNLVATTGIDQPYQSSGGGTVVLNSPTTANIYVYTYYFDPIAIPDLPQNEYPGSLPVPYEDIQLVHEVRSITVPNMLSASAESIYTLMSGRDYYRCICSVVDGSSNGPNTTAGSMLTSRITRTRWVYDGNTPTLDEMLAAHLARAQAEIGRDLNEGTFYYDFSDRPWDSNSYGALGWALTASSSYVTTSPAYVEFLTDALYLATMANA